MENQGEASTGTLKSLQTPALAVPDRRPSPERLHELLDYNPETGELRWLPRGMAAFDSRFAGKLVGSVQGKGYLRMGVDEYHTRVHQVIWAMMTGTWAPDEIDHVNMNKIDNRWINLRQADHMQNAANRRARADSALGIKGVDPQPSGRFRARIRVRGRLRSLGIYDTPEEANAAYERAAQKYFGEFARAA